MNCILTAILFGYGVVLGSFINALVWRLARQEGLPGTPSSKKASKRISSDVRYSIFRGRSMCPACTHQLAARDLVPVLSWLRLGGKCRYCQKPISAQYLLVELVTGVLFGLFYLGWPFDLSGLHLVWFMFGLIYVVFFVALAVYDLKWFLLPDRLVYPLVALAFAQAVLRTFSERDPNVLWQAGLGALTIFGLFWGIYQVSKGAWIGGGDVKLALALGLIAGSPLKALLVVFLASLLGTAASVPVLLRGKKGLEQHIPFGPYLLAGCVLVLLYAERMFGWLQGYFML